MSITKLKYRLDLTGTAPENRIEHPVTIGVESNRSFAIPHGAFYADGFVLIDMANPQTPLKRVKDYELLYLYDKVSKLARGKEIVAVVKITNPDISTELVVHANIVGEQFVNHYEAILQAIVDLEIDDREVDYSDIEGMPTTMTAADHLQDIGDLFGFEYIVSILSELVSVSSSGAAPELKAIIDSLTGMETRLRDMIKQHVDSEGNVHKSNANQHATYTSIEIDSISTSIRAIIDDLAIRVLANATENESQDNSLTSIGLLFTQHTQTLAAIRNDLNSLSSNSNSNNEQITELIEADGVHDDRLESIEGDLSRNWEDQRELLRKLNLNTAAINELKQLTENHESRIDTLEDKFNILGINRVTIGKVEPTNPQEKDIWIQML